MKKILFLVFVTLGFPAIAAESPLSAGEAPRVTLAPGCLRWGCDLNFDVEVPASVQNSQLHVVCAQGGQTVWVAEGDYYTDRHSYLVRAILGYHDSDFLSPNLLGSASCQAVLSTLASRAKSDVLATLRFNVGQ